MGTITTFLEDLIGDKQLELEKTLVSIMINTNIHGIDSKWWPDADIVSQQTLKEILIVAGNQMLQCEKCGVFGYHGIADFKEYLGTQPAIGSLHR